ncbi:MAG: hypothetical protein QXR14_04940 [Sulfolobales archaeon]
MEYSYYLIFKSRKKGGEISFNVGTKERTEAMIKLGGRRSEELFTRILETLGRAGCITPIQTGNPRIYAVRGDVGPVLGAYLILIKRSRKIEYWIEFLNELLTGKYSWLGGAFSTLLELAIDLSKRAPLKSQKEYTLSPIIISAISSAMKEFVNKLKEYETKIGS